MIENIIIIISTVLSLSVIMNAFTNKK